MASRSFKVTLSYDGTDYCGWQVQPNGSSIQQALQHALSRILNERVTVTGSGRTDSGVHALGQVASCQLDTDMTTTQLHRALNGNLPWDIRVHAVEEMAPGFHAIRDAIRKRYRYRWSDAAWHDVFRRRYVWHVRTGRLDVDAMREAAVPLVGKHDFASFEAAGAPRKDSIRNVFELTVSRESPPSSEIVLEIAADGFLYNMVRNIVGSLTEVGRGKRPAAWIPEVLAAKDRRQAGPTAPPQGLYLVSVDYPAGLSYT